MAKLTDYPEDQRAWIISKAKEMGLPLERLEDYLPEPLPGRRTKYPHLRVIDGGKTTK